MTHLHMVSMVLDLTTFRRVAAVQGLARAENQLSDEGFALHHMLAETFGKGVIQPFRLMPTRNSKCTGSLYGYSTLTEVDLINTAKTFASPEAVDVFNITRLKTKPMPLHLPKGKRLGFDVRIRPVRKTASVLCGSNHEGDRRTLGEPSRSIAKGSEVDAFLLECLRKTTSNLANVKFEHTGSTRETVYLNWLSERLAPAAVLNLNASRVHHMLRRKVFRNKKQVDGPDVTVHGEITVTDPSSMMRLLSKGVGRHTAYGYGMLLLRPPMR